MPPSFTQTALLFIYMGVGLGCARLGVITQEFNRGIAQLLLKVTLPAMIFSSMLRPYAKGDLPRILVLIAVSFGVYAASILIACILAKGMGGHPARRGVYRFGLVFSNVGFMGFPVMNALFGGNSVFYTSIYNIAFQVLAFSVGLLLLDWDGDQAGRGRFQVLCNPNIVSAILGLTFFLAGWSIPSTLHLGLSRIGEMTTPLSMIFIGASLSQASSFRLLLDWRMLATSLYRVAAAPLLVYLALKPILGASGFPIEVPVMIAAMPAAANTAILATEAGADAEAASMLVSLSTLLSLVTIPLAAHLFFAK